MGKEAIGLVAGQILDEVTKCNLLPLLHST